MNIIISSLDEALQVTGSTTNVDINDIRFYCNISVVKLNPKSVTFTSNATVDSISIKREYSYNLEEASLFNKPPNYTCFKIKDENPCNFPNEQYKIKIIFDDSSFKETTEIYSLL